MAVVERVWSFATVSLPVLCCCHWAVLYGAESLPTPGERRVITVNLVDFAFRWCPPGEFMMGSPENARDQYGDRFVPQHVVKISRGFWLQETEVTQGQYEMVTGEKPSFWQVRKEDHPVEQITWNDASVFCQKLSRVDPDHDYRLPTESEWEYACRAEGQECRYGEIMEIAWVFMNTDEGEGSTGHRPVGMKKANAWGLHDMFGNVAEWCSDWHGPPPSDPTTDPAGPKTGERRIVRGDDCFVCWTFLRHDGACMAGSRSSNRPERASNTLGFRIVLIPSDG